MKRILLSLGSLVVMGSVLVIGSTGAFFSDSQTSAGNIFTAGSISLTIDHSLSSYNGVAQGGELDVVSDPTATFTGADSAGNAVALTFIHPAWTASIPGATWIWGHDGPSNPEVTQTDAFTKTFTWNGPISTVTLDVAADNFFSVSVNGILVGNDGGSDNNFTSGTQKHFVVPAADINQGANSIVVTGTNEATPSDPNPQDNPAGVLFKLAIVGSQTWINPIHLDGQTFWTFGDVKPGDTGYDVISVHDPANDAWTCLEINNVQNNENTLTPVEIAAGDTTPGAGGIGGGELGGYLHLFLWHDLNADGTYNPPTETAITPTPITFANGSTIALHDSTTGGPELSGQTDEIGSVWCAGTLTVNNTTGAITCDGSTVGNDAQTDSTSADLTFYATQARNQPNFTCASIGSNIVKVQAADLSTNGSNGSNGDWYFYDDTANVINNALGSFVAGPGTPPDGTGSAQMTLAGATSRTFLATSEYGGTTLASITQWSIGEWADSGAWSTSEVPFVRFNVDFTTGSPTFQGSLVYEPNSNGTVTQNTWQTWDLLNGGNAEWNYSGATWPVTAVGPDATLTGIPGTTLRTWHNILLDYPNIRMWAAGPQVGVRVGEPGPTGFTANVNFFSIATGGAPTVYEFSN